MTRPVSAWQFTFFRIVFGLYLAIHFAGLAPWAAELFGARGVIGDPALNPTHGLFPNPRAMNLPDGAVRGFVIALAGLSFAFAAGIARRTSAVLLWFGWSCLFHRNNLIANPSIPYVGLLLLCCALVPPGEPWSAGKRDDAWKLPVWIPRTAWILMAAGYTFSGLTKLSSPSWIDGSALLRLMDNPLARPGAARDLMLWLPASVPALMTWGTLAVELLFAPLALWRRTRPFVWLAMVALHLGILLSVDFADLSLGMLMIHLFTFDPAWLPAKANAQGPVKAGFDADCLMCNRVIRFLAAEDHARVLQFFPLARESGGSGPTTIVVDADGFRRTRSDAVLRLLEALGGHWRLMAMAGKAVPRFLRNAAYDWIAKRRHRWFRKTSCDLPSAKVLERFIDLRE